MKKCFFVLVFLFGMFRVYADQLAYISKEDAEKAADFIRSNKNNYLFCGCCDGDVSQKVKVVSVEVRLTGYENYYEVYVTFKGKNKIETLPIDLAYACYKYKKKYATIGSYLALEHDTCGEFKK